MGVAQTRRNRRYCLPPVHWNPEPKFGLRVDPMGGWKAGPAIDGGRFTFLDPILPPAGELWAVKDGRIVGKIINLATDR